MGKHKRRVLADKNEYELNLDEWNRLTGSNAAKSAIRDFQKAHHLPADDVVIVDSLDEPILFGGRPILQSEFDALRAKLGLPPKFQTELATFLIRGNSDPRGIWISPEDQEVYFEDSIVHGHRCIITPTANLDDPEIIQLIKDWQTKHKDSCSRPIRVGKKYDWTPVKDSDSPTPCYTPRRSSAGTGL